MKAFLAALIVSLPLAAPGLAQEAERASPEAATGRTDQASVTAGTWMIVAAHPLAAEAGAEMLARGGSAVDAAIAAQAVLGLVEPQSSGIGGGGFLVHYHAETGAVTTLDGRETAPQAVREDLFVDAAGEPLGFFEAVVSGRSVGVPGMPALLAEAHRRFGVLAWDGLFDPAIRLAEEGFAVTPRFVQLLGFFGERGFADNPEAGAYFFPGGTAPEVGDVLVNKDYATTLKILANSGPAPFYAGGVAAAIVAAVRSHASPGALAMGDMARYRVIERAPLCADWRDYRICGMGPPSAGALVVAQTLTMLERFEALADPLSPATTHAFVESYRLAWADRDRWLADSDFFPVPLEGLLAPAYLAARAALIDPAKPMAEAPAGTPEPREGRRLPDVAPNADLVMPSTTHFSVVDAAGNVVSMTSSIETAYGAQIMVGGFLLNNQLTDFSFLPEQDGRPVANRVAGGKRPLSSMSPIIVLDRQTNRPVLAIGSPGGTTIPAYVARAILAHLRFGNPIQDAVELPHVVPGRGGSVVVESDPRSEALKAGLAALGHTPREPRFGLASGLHAIAISRDGRLTAGIDPRREGAAAGE